MTLVAGALLWLLATAVHADAQSQAEPPDTVPLVRAASTDALASATRSFYERLGTAPAWVGHPDRLEQLRTLLVELRTDGLTPEHYGIDLIDRAAGTTDPDEQATLDRQLTEGFLLALIHVYRGKLDPHEVDAVWNVERRAIDVDAAITEAADSVAEGRIATLGRRARPQHPLYGRMQGALSRLLEVQAGGGWPPVGAGPSIDPGDSDPRVPALRRRLVLGGYLSEPGPTHASDPAYDAALESAVRRFQEYQYLEVDGRVGRQTVAALDVPIGQRIAQLRANLERGRWLLHDLDGDFVIVDIAGYRLHFIQHGFPTFTTRVQVGRPLRRTPIFRAQITHLTLNPRWIMPPTIYSEDALPEIRRNLRYLAKNALRVFDAEGREVDPRSIDWRTPPPDLWLRQDAGPDGALGRIAIRFPNSHAVYLHETPHTSLFGPSQRAFSSGCIRVEQPVDLALLLLGPDSEWTRGQMDAAFATRETLEVTLPRPIPILLMYWTTDLHPDGPTGFKPDVYGLDAAVLEALDRAPELP